MRLRSWLVAIFAIVASAGAQATTVSYELNNVAGNRWMYEFTIGNDSLAVPIDEFTIFFDRNMFSNLAAGTLPPDWDPFVAQPDLALPQDGFFDALALVSGISPGTSLGVFEVLVDFAGAGLPGSPLFTVVDPLNFGIIDQGVARGPASVPEPGTCTLFAFALLAIAAYHRRVRTRRAAPMIRSAHAIAT